MTESIDVLVAGAGVIGLAIARSLALAGREVLLLDQATDAGLETSSRNSEVIHSGIYYSPGSLKARFCVAGRHALYDYCRSRGVQTKMLGKLIVATTDNEISKLHTLQGIAAANGVDDLQLLTAEAVKDLEPEIVCRAALLSPSTGIVDSRHYMLSLLADAEAAGATVALRTEFVSAAQNREGFEVELRTEDGEPYSLLVSAIVNSGGHGAHAVARAIAGYPEPHLPPKYFAKGNYCSVSGATPFSHLIYPVPVPGALGIHVTLDMNNRVRLGPDIEWIDRLDYSVDPAIVPRFYEACATYWPGVRGRELATAYCGIRPKTHDRSATAQDFTIQGPRDHGVAGLVNLFGIESPGLTSSLAIAEHVKGLLASNN